MTASEKVAYIKGLIEGLGIDTSKNEGKVLSAIVDVLEDLALGLDDVENSIDELTDELDGIAESIDDIDNLLFGDDDEDDEDFDDDDMYDDDDEYEYSVECPACNQEFVVDEETLESNIIKCPNCGETLELEFEDEDDDDPDED